MLSPSEVPGDDGNSGRAQASPRDGSDITFDHRSLDYELAEVRAKALRHIAKLDRDVVVACDLSCVNAIAWEFAIDPPIVRVDRTVADDRIREGIDATTDLQTGDTLHEFLVPVERDASWLKGVSNQKVPPDDLFIGFIQPNRPMISIRLVHRSAMPEDALARRLEQRLNYLSRYAHSVSERIQQFNADLVEAITSHVNRRQEALMRGEAAQRATGIPSVYSPTREEEAAKIDRVMASLGGHLTGCAAAARPPVDAVRPALPRVFIVHGHDEHFLLETKDYVQNMLGLGEPVVLRDMPGLGKSIIEKFEREAERVDLVFVLLSPDDRVVNETANEGERRRARQNVIFEMGFFLGKLGRSSGAVLLLHKGPIELPSDIAGVEYIDASNGVRAAGEMIRRELRGLGLQVE